MAVIIDINPPVLSVSTRYRTNGTVTVNAEFSADTIRKEYSLDGTTWLAYSNPVTVSSNTTIQTRGYDAAENMSASSYVINNIVALDPNDPAAVTLTSKISKYNVIVKWAKPATQDKAKITGYEIEYNGEISIVKGTSFSLKNVDVSTGNTVQVRALDSLDRYGALSEVLFFDVKDVTAPKLGKITAVIDGYTGTLSWTGSDNVGIVQYVMNCAGQTQSVTSGTVVRFDNLSIGKYKAMVQGFDAAGNASKIGSVSLTVKDVTQPARVTGLVAPVASARYQATLTWAVGMDNSGKVVSYEIQLDNGKILKSSKNTLKISNLAVGTHSYQVRAVDKAKNIGAWSDTQTFIVKDMTVPAAVSVKAKVDGNSLMLTWKTPKDNVGVTGYILKHGVNLENTETLTGDASSWRLDGIAKGSYKYELTAFDAEDNFSKAKSGKAAIKNDLPVEALADWNFTPPDAIPSLAFESEPAFNNGYESLCRGDLSVSGLMARSDSSRCILSGTDLFKIEFQKSGASPLLALK